MKLFKNTIMAVTVVGFASNAIACYNWDISIDEFEYGTATLSQDSTTVCSYNGYGTNDGYQLNCNTGYTCYVDNSGSDWSYTILGQSYTGTAQCTVYDSGTEGSDLTDCQGNDGTC